MAEERRWISAPVAFIGFTIFWAFICYWAWQRFGGEHPWIVLGLSGFLYVLGLGGLSEEYRVEESFAKVIVVALLLAFFGWLLWTSYPGETPIKAVGLSHRSRVVGDCGLAVYARDFSNRRLPST